MEICGCPQQGTKICRNCDENPMTQIKNLTEKKSEKSEFNTSCQHVVIDLYKCNKNKLRDNNFIKILLIEACSHALLNVVDYCFHLSEKFNSGVVLFETGHISFHCHNEVGYVALDFYTYNDTSYGTVVNYIKKSVECGCVKIKNIDRGYLNIM